jgi:HK97 family phage major capsid protein
MSNEYTKSLKADKRAKVARMGAIVGDGKRSLPVAERREFDDLDYAVKGIDAQIATSESDDDDYRGRGGNRKAHRTEEDSRFTSYLRGKSGAPEYRASLDANSMTTGGVEPGVAGATGYSSGYLIPQGFWAQLSIALKAYGGLSSAFKYVQTDTGNPMPWPSSDPTAIVGKYITETNQLGFGGDSNGTDYQFGQGMLNAWTIVSGVILASVQLIEDSAFDVDAFVADRIGEAIGRKLAQEVYSGTGATACLGINTALNARGSVGTSGGAITATGGYVTLSAAKTVPVFGNYATPTLTELAGNVLSPTTILAMMMAVDPVYYPNAKFFMNAQQAWNLRSVTDGNGRPLLNFMNGLSADDVRNADYTAASPVAQLFGFPVIIDNSISNLAANATGGPIFGDLSRAMVLRVVRGDARVVTNTNPVVPNTMRLTERYADYLQVGYLGYLRVDSRSNDLRACATVKCAGT